MQQGDVIKVREGHSCLRAGRFYVAGVVMRKGSVVNAYEAYHSRTDACDEHGDHALEQDVAVLLPEVGKGVDAQWARWPYMWNTHWFEVVLPVESTGNDAHYAWQETLADVRAMNKA